MSQYSYVPGDQRLVDHIIGELKSKGIFDQFRKECIADVDTRPAYQNLRLRVEGSVSGYLSHQRWRPDLNKNGLRESLRKHIHEAKFLEQGVERIVDQVVNPKVTSVFIPQVEDLVYSYLGIERPTLTINSNNVYPNTSVYVNSENLLPTDLEAVSPDSVKSQDIEQKEEKTDMSELEKPSECAKMETDSLDLKRENEDLESPAFEPIGKVKFEAMQDTQLSGISDLTSHESNDSNSKPQEEIKTGGLKVEETSVNLDSCQLTSGTSLSNISMDIPLPDEPPKIETTPEESIQTEFKPSSDAESSSDSNMMRNMSPLTPIRSYNNENSCDAQPSFDERQSALGNIDGIKNVVDIPIPISTFRFAIESKDSSESNNSPAESKTSKVTNNEKPSLSFQFDNQMNLNNYAGPSYDDSSCSNNLHIDYQSDHNGATVDGKMDQNTKAEIPIMLSNDERSKSKDQNYDEKRKSSHKSRDSRSHSSIKHSKDRRLDSKHHIGSGDKKDSHSSDKKSSKDETSQSTKSRHSTQRDKSKERSEKKDRDRSHSNKDKHTSSHKSSSSSHRDSKSKHHSSSSSRRHSSTSGSKNVDEKKSSSGSRDKSDDKKDDSKDHRTGSKSSSREHTKPSSHKSDRDKSKSSNNKEKYDKEVNKDEKKSKKITDDHYSASGRGNRTRRSTDRDSNDGNSSSSKGSTFVSATKTTDSNAGEKSSSKSENNSSGCDSNGQTDSVEQFDSEPEKGVDPKEYVSTSISSLKPVILLDNHLNTPIVEAPQLPPIQKAPVRKPMIAANMSEAIKLMKIRRSMAAEQEKKRQEATLLIEFQEKIHSSVSQVFSGVSGPELEFACLTTSIATKNESSEIENKNNVELQLHQNNLIKSKLVSQNVVEDVVNVDKKPAVVIKQNDLEISNNHLVHEEECNEKGAPIDKNTFSESNSHTGHDEQDDFLNFLCGDPNKEMELQFFGHQEIYNAEVEKEKFSVFIDSLDKVDTIKKIFVFNCDCTEIDVLQEIYGEMGDHTIVNYNKTSKTTKQPASGLNKLNTQDLSISKELILPVNTDKTTLSTYSAVSGHQELENSCNESIYSFSPNLSSDCSMDLSMDYEKKIDEMMNKTSRQEIMEIIFGGVPLDSPSKMPSVVFNESRNDGEETPKPNLKRKRNGLTRDVGEADNNNHKVLMPNKIRKLSISEQISSTTEGETNHVESPANKSSLMGRARRVGLPKPKNASNSVPMSPSSDKSVENYEQNGPVKKNVPKLNGTVAKTQVVNSKPVRKNKLQQRYDTSDLYKPKLHYLSKRHSHVT